MLLNTLRIVIFKKYIFHHANTAIFDIYILFIALHIQHISIFYGNIYFFPMPPRINDKLSLDLYRTLKPVFNCE